jgi:hypothetical protein
MKKALLLGSLTALAALSFGCALTDYAGQPGTATGINIPQNKSHGVLSCVTDDRIANTQQTLEAITRDMLYKTSCSPDPFAPGADPTGFVSAEDARDWNRFIGMFASVTGAGVSGFAPGFDGQWEMAGVKDLADGSRRITTYMSTWTVFTGFPPFSCAFGRAFRSGSAEGGVYGESFASGGATAPPIPGFHPETIAIDNTQGFGDALGNCTNIVAITPGVVARGGYSTYVGATGRGGEGRLFFTPISRHEGLAEFLGGQAMTAQVGDVSVTAKGELLADGRVSATIVSLSRNGITYTAGDHPVVVTVNPGTGHPTPQVVGNPAEGVKLAQWAIDAGMTDRVIDLTGMQVKEFGITLPSITLTVSGSTLQHYIADQANGGADNGGGFGG